MDFSCMSFTFGSENENNNHHDEDDDQDHERTPSEIAAEESRCTY